MKMDKENARSESRSSKERFIRRSNVGKLKVMKMTVIDEGPISGMSLLTDGSTDESLILKMKSSSEEMTVGNERPSDFMDSTSGASEETGVIDVAACHGSSPALTVSQTEFVTPELD